MHEIKYAIILAIAVMSSACGENPIHFGNLNFEDACPDSPIGLCRWQVSYQVRSNITALQGSSGTVLEIDSEDGVGFVEQELVFDEPPDEGILSLSVAIKTEDVSGKGAGLNIGIYDVDDRLIHNVDMGYGSFSYARGTADWRTYSIEAVIAHEASKVKIGLINYGSGRALFDSLSTTFIPLRNRKPSDFAKAYISAAIDSVRRNSLRRDSVDFAGIRKKALQIAGDASMAEDNYLAIRYVLSALGDHHSFLMTAKERELWESEAGPSSETHKFSNSRIVEDFGYVSVPGFHSNDAALKTAFADTIQQQLRRMYGQKIRGWIVDLSDNDGGNMAPMLAGLEPLFSTDTLGFLIDVNGVREAWGRGDAFRARDGEEYVEVDNPVTLSRRLPIAVLYGGSTGSSGEIVIISFIGNALTRSFGRPSMGLTTGNGEFELPDGSYMYLASTQMAGRDGYVYSGPIIPDEVVEPESGVDELAAALTWLRTQR